MKNSGKPFNKGKFSSYKGDRKEFRKKDEKEPQSTQGITCFECNGHGHVKRECPNYLRMKVKAYAITLSDSDSSNSDSEDSKGLNLLVQELRKHSDEESMGIVEELDVEVHKDTAGLRENYNSLLEKSGEYAKVAKVAVKKMKKAEEDYRSLVVHYKEAKCEIETLNGELTEAYSKIKFLELEVVQANAKVEQVSSKKLNEVLSHQRPFSDKIGSRYTRESSSAVNISKEVKFVKAKEPVVVASTMEKAKVEKKKNVADQRMLNKPRNQSKFRSEANGRSPSKSQRGSRTNHICHHCGLQGHTRPNCYKLRALTNARDQRSRVPKDDKRNWAVGQPRSQNGDSGVMDIMMMIEAFTTCLANFNSRFEEHNSRTQSYRDITPNTHDVWVKRGTHA
ncbi:uncharacterized protein LOC126721462 [Quercus robur]|uniref:uncharacterized protein LOC126721462 n=1 Tax=Quercus robur TaxID=38942 RepID=UPI002162F033|nr:uncharacterized protein LOC126721462 [Quercus robur]